MSDLLEHTILTTRARQLPDIGPAPPTGASITETSPAETRPPVPPTPTAPDRHAAPWPRSAKTIIAILAVAALAALATFATSRSDDDGLTSQQIELLTAEQTRLSGELAAATERAAELTTQRNELDQRLVDLDAQLVTATAAVAELTAQRTGLIAERAALQSSLAAAEASVAELETRLATATDTTATLDERLAVLDVQVGYLLDRAVAAEAERDSLIELFPIEFESSLEGVDVSGDWNLSWDEAYCTGLPTCGNVPGFGRITITETSQGWLRVEADGVFDAGLFEIEGALSTITESRTAAPACDGAQRITHVGLTLYAHDVGVGDDGTHVIEDLAATFVIDAPATTTCPAGVAVYGAQLTPVG